MCSTVGYSGKFVAISYKNDNFDCEILAQGCVAEGKKFVWNRCKMS